ncbi:MAG TPA: hypothetical protein PKK01_14540 [Mycobacterium sp.]|nr:hypothetical protein [Mycobacterium sp.]HQE15629.1 hypothetical protein [Mycobacterium sp.]
MAEQTSHTLHRLTTPRAAALAGVIFAVLFAAAIILLRGSLPEGADPGSQWLTTGAHKMVLAAELVTFSGVAFLWFIGVVRSNLGRLEDRFFATVFLSSGLLFLAMMFVAVAVGAALATANDARSGMLAGTDVGTFGQMLVLKLSKTYALRMAAVFMMSLATIWLRTGLMPKWLVVLTYLMAVTLMVAADTTMWLSLSFPIWVLVVSVLLLTQNDQDADRRTG